MKYNINIEHILKLNHSSTILQLKIKGTFKTPRFINIYYTEMSKLKAIYTYYASLYRLCSVFKKSTKFKYI